MLAPHREGSMYLPNSHLWFQHVFALQNLPRWFWSLCRKAKELKSCWNKSKSNGKPNKTLRQNFKDHSQLINQYIWKVMEGATESETQALRNRSMHTIIWVSMKQPDHTNGENNQHISRIFVYNKWISTFNSHYSIQMWGKHELIFKQDKPFGSGCTLFFC